MTSVKLRTAACTRRCACDVDPVSSVDDGKDAPVCRFMVILSRCAGDARWHVICYWHVQLRPKLMTIQSLWLRLDMRSTNAVSLLPGGPCLPSARQNICRLRNSHADARPGLARVSSCGHAYDRTRKNLRCAIFGSKTWGQSQL